MREIEPVRRKKCRSAFPKRSVPHAAGSREQSRGSLASCYGALCSETTSVSVRRKPNRRFHLLPTARPRTCGGVNVHSLDASKACLAKYLLGPGETSLASVTLPDGSTSTRTSTLIFPSMVSRELDEMRGKTLFNTAPFTTASVLLSPAGVSRRAAGLGLGSWVAGAGLEEDELAG